MQTTLCNRGILLIACPDNGEADYRVLQRTLYFRHTASIFLSGIKPTSQCAATHASQYRLSHFRGPLLFALTLRQTPAKTYLPFRDCRWDQEAMPRNCCGGSRHL